MSPSDLEEHLFQEPFTPLRLTLSSGDQLIVDNNDRALISGLTLLYSLADDPTSRLGKKLRVVSIPNIVLVEPAERRHRRNGRRRR